MLLYPVAYLDTGRVSVIFYTVKIDTTYKAANGLITHDSVFIVSADHSYPLYNLSFSDVGQGLGNYILNSQGLNGNVYQWISPTNGDRQGQFEAAEFLVTPKTQQVITAGQYKGATQTGVVISKSPAGSCTKIPGKTTTLTGSGSFTFK